MMLKRTLGACQGLIRQYAYPVIVLGALYCALQVKDQDASFCWQILAQGLLLTAVIGYWFVWRRQAVPLPHHPLVYLWLIFIAWLGVALSWSVVFSDSLISSMVFLNLPLALVLGYWGNARQKLSVYWGLQGLLLVIASLTLYQSWVEQHERPGGFFANWNSNALFLAMLLLPACGDFMRTALQGGGRWRVLGLALLIAYGCFAMSLTLSRAGVAAFFIGLLVLAIYACRVGVSLAKLLRRAAVLASLAGLIFVLHTLLGGASSLGRLRDVTFASLHGLSSGRADLWSVAWRLYREKPLGGWGIDSFHWLYPQYREPLLADFGQFVHNDYLQLLMESGPLAPLLVIAFGVGLCVVVWRRSARPDNASNLRELGMFAACIALLLHSVVDFNLYQPSMVLLLGWYCGVLLRDVAAEKPMTCIPAHHPWCNAGLAAFVLLWLGFHGCLWISSVWVYGGTGQLTRLERLARYEQGARWFPLRESYYAAQAHIIFSIVLFEPLPLERQRALLQQGLAQVERALKHNPYRALNFENKAKLLILQGDKTGRMDFPAIQHAYREAIRLDPFNIDTRLNYAQFLINRYAQQPLTGIQYILNVLEGGLNRSYYAPFQKGIDLLHTTASYYAALGRHAAAAALQRQAENLISEAKTKPIGLFTLRRM